MAMINLGAKARDKVSGFQGVCVCLSRWLGQAGARVTLQPPVGKDGKLPPAETFDEENLELVKVGRPAGKPATKRVAGKPMVK